MWLNWWTIRSLLYSTNLVCWIPFPSGFQCLRKQLGIGNNTKSAELLCTRGTVWSFVLWISLPRTLLKLIKRKTVLFLIFATKYLVFLLYNYRCFTCKWSKSDPPSPHKDSPIIHPVFRSIGRLKIVWYISISILMAIWGTELLKCVGMPR